MTARITSPTITLALVSLVALAGCSSAEAERPSAPSSTAGGSVTVQDAWAKAAESGMSAVFGDLTNTGVDDVTVVSVTSPASSMLELHETVEDASGSMVMREKDGGFTIPAGGELALEPGANHIMLMDLAEPLVAGAEITVTLTFSDDSTLDVTAPVKDYAGANESYEGTDGEHGTGEPAHSHTEHGDTEHGDVDRGETDGSGPGRSAAGTDDE